MMSIMKRNACWFVQAGVFVFLGGVSTWEVARCAKRSCGFGGITRIAIAETTGGACAPILCGDVHALP